MTIYAGFSAIVINQGLQIPDFFSDRIGRSIAALSAPAPVIGEDGKGILEVGNHVARDAEVVSVERAGDNNEQWSVSGNFKGNGSIVKRMDDVHCLILTGWCLAGFFL